jgi:plastocyanin
MCCRKLLFAGSHLCDFVPRRTHGGNGAKGLLDVITLIMILVLASSLALFLQRPARASGFVIVDVSEITPTLFDPQGVNITVGDTVIWFGIHDAHTTTADPGQAEYWDCTPLTEGLTFSYRFTRAGNFTYHSTFPEDAGQIGWVYVKQPVPEFPGYTVYMAVAAAVILALLIERRLRT